MNDPEHDQMEARHIEDLHAHSDRTDVAPRIGAGGRVALMVAVVAVVAAVFGAYWILK